MTIQTIQEGFALMGASLSVNREAGIVTVCFRGIVMSIELNRSQEEMEGALFFLNLNMPNWFRLVKEALAEEEKGGTL